jgi:hypothetical protein
MQTLKVTFIVAVAAFGAILTQPAEVHGQDGNLKQMLDEAQRRAKRDLESEKGRMAMESCNRKLGIRVPAKNALDVARAHGQEKVLPWMECVNDTLYPVKP